MDMKMEEFLADFVGGEFAVVFKELKVLDDEYDYFQRKCEVLGRLIDMVRNSKLSEEDQAEKIVALCDQQKIYFEEMDSLMVRRKAHIEKLREISDNGNRCSATSKPYDQSSQPKKVTDIPIVKEFPALDWASKDFLPLMQEIASRRQKLKDEIETMGISPALVDKLIVDLSNFQGIAAVLERNLEQAKGFPSRT